MSTEQKVRAVLGLGPSATREAVEAEVRRLQAARVAAAREEEEAVRVAALSFESSEADGVDMDSVRVHVAAMRQLAARGITEPTEDEYAAAAEAVEIKSRTLREVRIEEGLASPSETKVTEVLLLNRADEIIREQGLLPDLDGVGPSPEQRKAAIRQALEELGDVGEQRRDVGERRSAASAVPDVLRVRMQRSDAIHNVALGSLEGRLPDTEAELLAAYERAQTTVDFAMAEAS